MTYLECWLILAACAASWIAWDTRKTKNPELALYTQWSLKLDDDLPLPQFEALEVAHMEYAEIAGGLENWCAQVDLYQWNEQSEIYQQSERWTAFHEQRLNESLV